MWIRITLAVLALVVLGALSQENPQKVAMDKKKRGEMLTKLRSLLTEKEYDDFFELLGEDRVSDYLEMLIGYGRFAGTIVYDTLRLHYGDTRPQPDRRSCRWECYLKMAKSQWYGVFRQYTMSGPVEARIVEDLATIYDTCNKLG